MNHISEDDLERFHLGMVKDEAELASHEHLLVCSDCIDSAEEAAQYVDTIRAAIIVAGFDVGAKRIIAAAEKKAVEIGQPMNDVREYVNPGKVRALKHKLLVDDWQPSCKHLFHGSLVGIKASPVIVVYPSGIQE